MHVLADSWTVTFTSIPTWHEREPMFSLESLKIVLTAMKLVSSKDALLFCLLTTTALSWLISLSTCSSVICMAVNLRDTSLRQSCTHCM